MSGARDFVEINFDGLVGPTHNYAGLSLGNVASAANAGAVSSPRRAALQGLEKMRRLMALDLPQGVLPPQTRPHLPTLRALGFAGSDDQVCAQAYRDDPALVAAMCSAAAMWTANAATISPAPDTADGRLHATVANRAAMAHRAVEPGETLSALRRLFRDKRRFAVHGALPLGTHMGDEGAANHMRLAPSHGAPGVEVFVYGEPRAGAAFPARQARRASAAVARLHGLSPARTLFAAQAADAIEAGAFHNDVVAVANGPVLFAHERAFADRAGLYAALSERAPWAEIVEVAESEVSLADAIATYLFNGQLLTVGDAMILVVPAETQRAPAVKAYLDALPRRSRHIAAVEAMDLRESMRNGGGPACLRLRVQLSSADVRRLDPAFLLTARRLDALQRLVERLWPERVAPEDLGDPHFWAASRAAMRELAKFGLYRAPTAPEC